MTRTLERQSWDEPFDRWAGEGSASLQSHQVSGTEGKDKRMNRRMFLWLVLSVALAIPASAQWHQVPGSLVQVASGTFQVWGSTPRKVFTGLTPVESDFLNSTRAGASVG